LIYNNRTSNLDIFRVFVNSFDCRTYEKQENHIKKGLFINLDQRLQILGFKDPNDELLHNYFKNGVFDLGLKYSFLFEAILQIPEASNRSFYREIEDLNDLRP